MTGLALASYILRRFPLLHSSNGFTVRLDPAFEDVDHVFGVDDDHLLSEGLVGEVLAACHHRSHSTLRVVVLLAEIRLVSLTVHELLLDEDSH